MFILDNAILSEMQVSFLSGIYSFVIKVYDIMLDLIESSNLDLSKFESIATVMYVLAGVFILFKVIIAMIQMILNPDTISDKQAGAGGLIKRIVICLILLIAFAPNGFIFGHEGIFKRIETALLKENGLINNITKAGTNLESTKEPFYGYRSYYASDILIENVYAAETFSCYYYRIDKVEAEDVVAAGANNQKVTVNKIYKITFKVGGNQGGYQKAYDSENIYYKQSTGAIGNGQYVDSSGNPVNYNKLGYPIKANSEIKNGKCPSAMFYKKNKQYWNAESDVAQKLKEGLHGGETTLEGLQESLKELSRKTGIKRIISNNAFVTGTVPNNLSGGGETNHKYLDEVRPSSIDFGQAVASSMQDCAVNSIPDCVAAQDKMFESSEDNDRVVDLVKEDKLETGFFISIVVGIILVIYLLFLSVEVIIRRLKLFFLEVIAPIPIISYVDPKDQKLNTWFKMYFSTYLDLFIKLIAIKLAIVLLEIICEDFSSPGNSALGLLGNALTKFFYIVAILVFAKILPTMISKILNLDSLGGSFKDIASFGKGAAGFGAGAAIGGAVGLATGGVGGLVRGTLRGAGAGVKGDFTGGAGKTAAYNRNLRNARAAGSTATGRFLAGLGINDYEDKKREIDNEKAKLAEEKANAMEEIQRKKTKNSNTLSNIEGFEKRVEKNFDRNKYDDIKMNDQWSTVQVGSANNAMAKVKAYREASANLKVAESSGDAERIRLAEAEVSATKGAALDAVKNFEAICKVDGEAKAYLENIGSSIVANGFSGDGGIDAQKKSLTASNIALNSQISNLDVEYTEKQQKIEASERALENSKSKANYDAVNKLK